MIKKDAYQYAIKCLMEIEKKYSDFFEASNLNLMECVEIRGTTLVSVHIINHDLPPDIRYEIEEIFWID